jgi:hypothetical protein
VAARSRDAEAPMGRSRAAGHSALARFPAALVPDATRVADATPAAGANHAAAEEERSRECCRAVRTLDCDRCSGCPYTSDSTAHCPSCFSTAHWTADPQYSIPSSSAE